MYTIVANMQHRVLRRVTHKIREGYTYNSVSRLLNHKQIASLSTAI